MDWMRAAVVREVLSRAQHVVNYDFLASDQKRLSAVVSRWKASHEKSASDSKAGGDAGKAAA